MDDSSGSSANSTFRSGMIYGLLAYSFWGIVPIYFHALGGWQVNAGEILANRIVWALPLLAALTTLARGWPALFRVFGNRKLLLTLGMSAVLLSGNWLLYIYATVTHRVSEASLGYYMMPLANAFLATVFLKEKLRPAHYVGLTLIAIGVAIPLLWGGEGFTAEGDEVPELPTGGGFPWIAVLLPISFGLYGLVRKQVAVEAMTGLAVESVLLLPFAAGYMLYLSATGVARFGSDWDLSRLLMLGGLVTVVPLVLFAMSVRRLPLLANSFIQFVSPTIQFLIARYWIGEQFGPDRWAAMACTWVAVAIFLTDAGYQAWRKRYPAREPEPELPAALAAPQLVR